MDKGERNANLLEEVKLGMEAKTLASHPVFEKAVKELETSYFDAIRSGNWLQKRAREENCRRLQVLDDLVVIIKNKIERGEQALKRLEANNADK